jgi:hypothetical protein
LFTYSFIICFNNYFITYVQIIAYYSFEAVLSLSLQVGGRKMIEH